MFKKLKKKIEDGDVASPDRSPFGFSAPSTRMAVPGIPVRLPSETETPQESKGNNSSVQQIEGGNTERRAERIDENAQVPLDGKGRITGVEPVANDVPRTGALSTGTGVDPTVPDGTSVEKTTTKASTGWSSLGVKAQGLTAMIRGDSSAQQQLLGECACVRGGRVGVFAVHACMLGVHVHTQWEYIVPVPADTDMCSHLLVSMWPMQLHVSLFYRTGKTKGKVGSRFGATAGL